MFDFITATKTSSFNNYANFKHNFDMPAQTVTNIGVNLAASDLTIDQIKGWGNNHEQEVMPN